MDMIEDHYDREYINTVESSITPRAENQPVQSGVRYIGLQNAATRLESD